MPRGEPTTPESFRVENGLLERIQADADRQGKARKDWWTDLAIAVLDGKLVYGKPKAVPSTRKITPYLKADHH